MRDEVHCEWCAKEVAFLHKASRFSEKEIKAYTVYYGIFSGEPIPYDYTGLMVGYSEKEAKAVVQEVAAWLAENSPYRGRYPTCVVCNQVRDAMPV